MKEAVLHGAYVDEGGIIASDDIVYLAEQDVSDSVTDVSILRP